MTFAKVFQKVREAYNLVNHDEQAYFLSMVDTYLHGGNPVSLGNKSATLALMAVKPYLEPFRQKGADS